MNTVIRNVAREFGALLFPLDKIMSKDSKYFVGFCHNNKAGAELKANLLADFIISEKLTILPKM